MKIEQVAIQLYTLRNQLKTPEAIRETLAKVAEIGYPAVQVSGMGPIDPAELVAICRELGLTICATHEPSDVVRDNPAAVVERLRALGCRYTAYPFPAGVDFASAESVDALIADLNEAGKVLAEAGQVLTYHNHHQEFRKIDGELILERIYGRSNAQYLQGEIDTYWVQYGGGCPVAWSEKLRGRLPLIHLKDYRIDEENKPLYCEIGKGNLDFKAIVAAAEAAGCEWFIVEQDETPGDPFDSIRESLEYIRAHLLG